MIDSNQGAYYTINRSKSHGTQLMSVVLAALGAVVLVRFLYSLGRLLVSLFVLPGISIRSYGRPSQTWAVVTGASDGLGKEFALQLARSGFSILLISRTASKLEAVEAEIKATYGGGPTRTLAIDFALNDRADMQKLQDTVDSICNQEDQEIGILINNVGLSHSIPVPFMETPTQEMEDIVQINCLATLKVTRIVAEKMLQRRSINGNGNVKAGSSNRRGLIITMGSFGGAFPTPLLATYSGSKAFLQQWSSALASELGPAGITVQLVQSYLVTTAMSKIRRSSLLIPTPRQFVSSVLTKIGRTGGAQGYANTSTPYWTHALMQYAIGCLVAAHSDLLVTINHRVHHGIRTMALKKQNRQPKVNVEGGSTKTE